MEQAHSLEEIKARNVQDRESLLLPMEEVLSPWTALSLTEEGEQKVRYGQDLPAEDIREQDMELLQEGSCVRLIGDCGKFLGIGRVVHRQPGLTIHPEKVWACCG
jgi:tRNA U55 pseudouridine synthase TruB